MTYLANITRPAGDPKVLRTGPSSLGSADRLARALGWASIGLGIVELLAPSQITRAIGMEGHESMVRAFGMREIGSGFVSLGPEKDAGLWSRVAGDGLDMAALLAAALRRRNPKRGNAGMALACIAGITLLDMASAEAATARHARQAPRRMYSDRSGFPKGLENARGAAKDAAARAAPAPA